MLKVADDYFKNENLDRSLCNGIFEGMEMFQKGLLKKMILLNTLHQELQSYKRNSRKSL